MHWRGDPPFLNGRRGADVAVIVVVIIVVTRFAAGRKKTDGGGDAQEEPGLQWFHRVPGLR
jgi:hypothetical protein